MSKKVIEYPVSREDARKKRRKKRQRVVLIEKLTIGLVCVAVLAGAGAVVYNLTPGYKIAKQLKEADAYMESENYDDAIASCEEALKIDSSSVEAYSAMAGAYLTKEDSTSAERVLYQGWETTQDESLLKYYCTVLLNEAVADINNQNTTLATVDKCVLALEKDGENEDAYYLLDACYERLFSDSPEQEGLLCNAQADAECGYQSYQNIMLRMLLVYEASPSDKLKEEILKFAVPGNSLFWLDVEHLEEYQELLSRIMQVGETEEVTQLYACAAKAAEAQQIFDNVFSVMESGDFSPIRDFMSSEEYLSIRDAFMDDAMDYWEGTTYIPVSRDKMKLFKEDEGWKFSFADYEEGGGTSDVINIWSVKQEDAGVQRIAISYEPAVEDGEYYPHTVYEFIYLYSNVKINGEYVPQMNYRFETRVETQEGTTTQLIGDWGGEHEWTTEF